MTVIRNRVIVRSIGRGVVILIGRETIRSKDRKVAILIDGLAIVIRKLMFIDQLVHSIKADQPWKKGSIIGSIKRSRNRKRSRDGFKLSRINL